MASLQSLLTQSVTQSLGLGDLLKKRQQQAQRLGQSQVNIAGIQAQSELRRKEEEERKKQEAKSREAGVFGTIGQILGGVAGFALAGPVGLAASLGAAQTGASLGQAAGRLISPAPSAPLSGSEQLISTGLSAASTLASAAKTFDLQKRTTEVAEGTLELAKQKALDTGTNPAKTAVELLKTGKFTTESIESFRNSGLLSDVKFKEEKGSDKLPPAKRNLAQQSRVAMDIAVKILNPILEDEKELGAELFQQEFLGRFAGDTAKKIRSSVQNALDSIIRFRTGAVVNAEEMKLYMNVFGPQTGDSADVVKFKMNQLDSMIRVMQGEDIDPDFDIFGNSGLQELDKITSQLKGAGTSFKSSTGKTFNLPNAGSQPSSNQRGLGRNLISPIGFAPTAQPF